MGKVKVWLLLYINPNILWSANLEVLFLTPRDTNAEKIRSLAPLENFGWALFGIMTTSHWEQSLPLDSSLLWFGPKSFKHAYLKMESHVISPLQSQYWYTLCKKHMKVCAWLWLIICNHEDKTDPALQTLDCTIEAFCICCTIKQPVLSLTRNC